jgi:hypothetical protein
LSHDVQDARYKTKEVAAAGKAVSTTLKRVTENSEHKKMRDAISDAAIYFLSNSYNDVEGVTEKIDQIVDNLGMCKNGKLVWHSFHKHFSDHQDTESTLSRKLFDAPEIESEEIHGSAKEKSEAERRALFATKICQAKVN